MSLAILVTVLGGVILLMGFAVRRERLECERLSKQWHQLDEGVYETAEYGYWVSAESRRSGAMVHTTRTEYRRIETTVVRFEDGRTRVLDGRHSMTCPRGACIRIMRNGLGRCRIDAV